MRSIITLLLLCLSVSACKQQDGHKKEADPLAACYALAPLSGQKAAPAPGDWLYEHPGETGQSIERYMRSGFLRTDTVRRTLYIVKIGDFDTAGRRMLDIVSSYLSLYFLMPVDTIASVPFAAIPVQQQRQHQGYRQINSKYVLDSLLPGLKPADAFALIAFTARDLYPDAAWNYVFGQASLSAGVGVWSVARLGDYNASAEDFKHTLLRTMKVASHETAHMLGMHHCIRYRCNVNGSNSLQESDGQPVWLCWQCLAKLCYHRNAHPLEHLEGLYAFHSRMGLDTAAVIYYKKALDILRKQS